MDNTISGSHNETQSELSSFIDSLKEICRFRATLNAESDRGCALMAAAYLEGKIRDLLRCVYVDNTALVEEELRHLSFADTANQAYLLGLLPEKMKRDIDLIRKIRNEFAHTDCPVDFETGSIADRCQCLYHASRFSKKAGDCRSEFISAAISIASCLAHEQTMHQHAAIPDDIDYDEESLTAQLAALLTRDVYESLRADSINSNDENQSAHWDEILRVFDSIYSKNDFTLRDN